MFTCPQCRAVLQRTQTRSGIFWLCPACGGRAVTVSLLRSLVHESTMRELWSRTFNQGLPKIRPCPSCHRAMQEIPVTVRPQGIKLDVCRTCQFVWFDPQEFECMPPLPPKPVAVDTTPQAVKEAVALAEVERMGRELAEQEPDLADLKNIPAILGLPVETEPGKFKRLPWLTWVVATLVATVSLLALGREQWIDQYALVPAELWRMGGLTLLTSFFLHAGIWHLASNLYFLVAFGDNVEDYLGRWRWILLLLLADLSGALAHVMLNPQDTAPCIGASGGISGLLAFYAFRFPHARLGVRIWMRYSYRAPWITFPAWGWFVVWMLLQMLGLFEQLQGVTNVSSVAHLGGVAVGVAAWLVWRNIESSASKAPAA